MMKFSKVWSCLNQGSKLFAGINTTLITSSEISFFLPVPISSLSRLMVVGLRLKYIDTEDGSPAALLFLRSKKEDPSPVVLLLRRSSSGSTTLVFLRGLPEASTLGLRALTSSLSLLKGKKWYHIRKSTKSPEPFQDLVV